MSIYKHILALTVAATFAAPVAFAQVDEAAPMPAPSAEPTEPSPPLQKNAPVDPAAQEPDASASSSAPATGAIDDQKIEQFANAYVEVASIQRNASAELQSASDPVKAEEVKANAETAMIAAVERSGLDVNEFNRIIETMSADVNVRSRIAAELQERTGTSAAQPEASPEAPPSM